MKPVELIPPPGLRLSPVVHVTVRVHHNVDILKVFQDIARAFYVFSDTQLHTSTPSLYISRLHLAF